MNPHDDVEAYVLGALDPADLPAFETHLAGCAECRDAIASYAGVVAALRRLPIALPPPLPRVRRSPRAWFSGAGVAAVLALAIGLAAALNANRGDDDARAIAEMLGAHARVVALAGPAAHGSALVDAGGRRTAFIVSGLPAAPRGRGYQVWVRGAAVRSPGMLHRLRDGLEVLVVNGDAIAGAKRIGITDEPAAGSPMRTGALEAGAVLPG